MKIVVRVKDPLSVDRALELIYDKLSIASAHVKVKGDRLEIDLQSFVGDPGQVRRQVLSILASVGLVGSERPRGLRRYEVPAGLPADLVAEVLKLKGYDSLADEEGLLSRAPEDVVRQVASEAEGVWGRLSGLGLALSASAKKAVAAASLVTGRSAEELVEEALSLGLFVKRNAKILCTTDWRRAARELRRRSRVERGAEDNQEA